MSRKLLTVSFLTIFILPVFCQSVGDFLYITENGSVTITGYSGSAREVVIPRAINGMPVTVIGADVFVRRMLTIVILPDTLVEIKDRAFSFNHLTSITLPDSLTTLGYMAFSNNRLTNVIFSDSLLFIGMHAFSSNRLRDINFPDSLEYIGDRSFTRNYLTSVVIPGNVKNFNSFAFDRNVKISWR